MPSAIGLKEVPIFKYIPRNRVQNIVEIFDKITGNPHEVLFAYGQEVPGLYVLLEGSFDICIPGSDLPIACLNRGDSVGEMSFVATDSLQASATVRCADDGATYIFATRQTLLHRFECDPVLARCMYQGIAEQLSQRLKSTNEKISEQLAHGRDRLEKFMKEIEMFSKLDQTKNSLDETGFHIINHLSQVKSKLDKLAAEKNELAASPILAEIQSDLDQVILSDSQNFDRICQMLDQLFQYFDNLQTLVQGGTTSAIRGDLKLFKTG